MSTTTIPTFNFDGVERFVGFKSCFKSHFSYLTEEDLRLVKEILPLQVWIGFLRDLQSEVDTFVLAYLKALNESSAIFYSNADISKNKMVVLPFQIVMNHPCKEFIDWTVGRD